MLLFLAIASCFLLNGNVTGSPGSGRSMRTGEECCKSKGVPRLCLGFCVREQKKYESFQRSTQCYEFRQKIEACLEENTSDQTGDTMPMVKKSKGRDLRSTDYAKIALSKHNYYRQLHGSPPLSLDSILSFGAQKHALKLATKGKWLSNSDHDQNRGNVGENIGQSCSSASYPSIYDGYEVTDSWYSEEKLYDYDTGAFSPETGHFTQVVWRSSTKFGIGIGKGKVDNMFCTWVVGRYFPAGNVQGQYEENVMRPSK